MANATQATVKEAGKDGTITVDGKTYNVADLSADARKRLQAYAVADAEVRRLTMQLGMIKTARSAYLQALTAELPPAAK